MSDPVLALGLGAFALLLLLTPSCHAATLAEHVTAPVWLSGGLAVLAAWLFAAALHAATPFPQAGSDLKADPAARFGTLPNGLRYVVRANKEPKDRAALRAAKPVIDAEINGALDAFYAQVRVFPETRKMFSNDAHISNAQGRQASHWRRLATAEYGAVAPRPRSRDPYARRRDQPADHQILGRLVEHPAPARLGDEARRLGDPSHHPLSAARDGAGVRSPFHHAAHRGDAQRNPAPPRPHADDDEGAGRVMMDLFGNLGPHAQFIVIAYAIAAATMAALIGWVWLDYRAQKAALDDLESRGITRRSARASEKTA